MGKHVTWTPENLRLHLTALIDRDNQAHREAVRIALEAVKDRQNLMITLCFLGAALVSLAVNLFARH
jgi:hypothetical protein